jgi:WD40 repeat protein
VVTGGEDSKVRFINIAEGKVVTIKAHRHRVVGIGFAPDDSLVASASFDKTIKFYDRYGNQTAEHELGHQALGLCFSPDGKRLFVTTQDRNLFIFDMEIKHRLTDKLAKNILK